MRDDEESAINKSVSDNIHSKSKPVSDEDRRDATHTTEPTESTKHNADKVSCNLTASEETSRQQYFHQQSLESSDKNKSFDGEEYQIVIQTQSWRTAKNWKSSAIAEDQGILQLATSAPSLISLQCSQYVFSSFLAQHRITVQKPVYDLPFFHLGIDRTSRFDIWVTC